MVLHRPVEMACFTGIVRQLVLGLMCLLYCSVKFPSVRQTEACGSMPVGMGEHLVREGENMGSDRKLWQLLYCAV
jgi:hypothetical protein